MVVFARVFITIFYKYRERLINKMLMVIDTVAVAVAVAEADFIYPGRNDIGYAATKFIRAGTARSVSAVYGCLHY